MTTSRYAAGMPIVPTPDPHRRKALAGYVSC